MNLNSPLFALLNAIVILFSLSSCATSTNRYTEFDDAKWIVLGQYPNPAAEDGSCTGFRHDYLEAFGGEATLSSPDSDPLPRNAGIRTKHNEGFLDIGSLFRNAQWSVAYVYTEFDSAGGEYFLHAGSDDGLRLWLNGELIIDDHEHRSISPHDAVRRITLREGKNRILAKICQGTGEWALSLKLYDEKQQKDYLSSISSASLTVVPDSSFIQPGQAISFRAKLSPQTGNSVPVRFHLLDEKKSVVAELTGQTEVPAEFFIPMKASGLFTIRASLPDGTANEAEAKFLAGDRDTIFASVAQEARKSASDRKFQSIPCISESLLFLADRLEGKLHPSLSSDELKIHTVGFIKDILAAVNSCDVGYQANNGLNNARDHTLNGQHNPVYQALTGYRQWAYRSEIDKSLQPFSLYIPSDYNPEKKYGLIVQLHGYSGNDYEGGIHLADLAPSDMFIVSAYGRGDVYYESLAEQDVLDVMDIIMDNYPIDPDRVYLTGNSMGGLGAWKIAQRYPDRFAAIASFSGWTGTELLDNLGNLAIFVAHGENDTEVPVHMDRIAVEILKKAGYNVTYYEIPGGGHSAWKGWTSTNDPQKLFDFFRSYTRNPSPEYIKAIIPTVRYGRHYWVTISELDTAGDEDYHYKKASLLEFGGISQSLPMPGKIEAKRIGNSEINVTTSRIRTFSIDIPLSGIDLSKPTRIVIDGQKHEINPLEKKISFSIRSDGNWEISNNVSRTKIAPHDGDGVAGLFMKPVIIVYGTMDIKRKESLEAGARQLADWSWTEAVPIGVKTGSFRVKADTELTGRDIAENNLILIGNSKENSFTSRISEVFAPYYSNGKISINGKTFEGNGLCVTRPNPLAPERLVACFDIPSDFLSSKVDIIQWFRVFPYRMRYVHISESATYPAFCPDVMVLSKYPDVDVWSGWFDRNWENLKGW